MVFLLIMDAQVHFKKDEFALNTDVASDAFKTNKLCHKEYTTLRGESFLSGSVMCIEFTDKYTLEHISPFVRLQVTQAPVQGLGHSRKCFLTSW